MMVEILTGLARGDADFDARLYSAQRDEGSGVVLSIEFGRLWIDITFLWRHAERDRT